MAPWIWAGLDRASGVAGSGGASDGALSGIWRDAHAVWRAAVEGVYEVIGEALANGEDARILGSGTFGTRNRPARTARNPRMGENVSIAASTVPVFRLGKTLKDVVASEAS